MIRSALLFVTLSLIACSHSAPSKPPAGSGDATTTGAPAAWHQKMQALSEALSRLLPLVSNRAKFNAPANAPAIEEDVKQLRALAHDLKDTAKPNSDPSLKMMTNLFGDDLDHALEGLRGGNRDYARQILKDTTAYCIQCHTQTNNGPDFPRLALNINTNELTSLEQAEFFTATRQFTPALEAYERVLSDRTLAKTDPFAWEQAVRSALAIVVRVKNDPHEASELLSRLDSVPTLPEATRRAVKAWKKSVRAWETEPRTAKPATVKALIQKAEALIMNARKAQEFPLDHSQDIPYFRAASLLHDALGTPDRSPAATGEALYLSGLASEATRDMNFWTLHETYYEQCIHVVPHTEQARKCFARLSDSLTVGYSGSAGTKIPVEVENRLAQLKTLAN